MPSSAPKLLLHIGTHKTGTTSIQRFCSSNRATLREHGLWYPSTDVGRFPGHYAHHRVSHAIAGKDEAFGPRDAGDFFNRVRRKMNSNETILVSAEPLYRHVLPDPATADDGRSAAERQQDDFVRYAQSVRHHTRKFDVTVLVMLRRQDHFLESLYAEHVLATAYTRSIDAFERGRRHLLDFDARLDGWARAFGDENIRVKVFDPRSWGVPIEQAFIEWVGLAWSDDFQIGRRHNVTPARAFVEYKRMINVLGQPPAVTRQYRRWVEQLSTSMDGDEVPDLGRVYLPAERRHELFEQYADGNRAVAERFNGGRPLFETELSPEHAAAPAPRTLTFDEYRDITGRLVRMIADESAS